jgi:hypothetical protein
MDFNSIICPYFGIKSDTDCHFIRQIIVEVITDWGPESTTTKSRQYCQRIFLTIEDFFLLYYTLILK